MKNLTNLLFRFIIASTLLSILFYFRLVPREARDLWQNITYKQIFIILITITLIIFNIYSILKTLGYLKPSEESKITKIFTKCSNYVNSSFIAFYEIWIRAMEYIAETVLKKKSYYYHLGRRILKSANKEKYFTKYIIFLLTLKYVPKIIFLGSLIVDIFIFKRFDYTYKCIPLLLIPLIPSVIIFVLKHYFDIYHQHIYSKLRKRHEQGLCIYFFEPEYEKNPPFGEKDFVGYFNNHYLPLSQLRDTLELYDNFIKKIQPNYIMLLFAFCRLVVYLFILYYGLYN